jgi:hypothetical protein
MTAATATRSSSPTSVQASAVEPAASAPQLVPALPVPVVDDSAQRNAEATLVRRALLGAGIGAIVCAAIWVGLVAIAIVGNGTALTSTFAMAAGCGIFAGIFLGGCAGALAGTAALEKVEHDRMHPH